MSLISRSPSPSADAMDVDAAPRHNEYLRGASHEVITVETKIKPTNVGFAMLQKLGWSEGQPLGLHPDARVDPIPFNLKNDSTGVGKISQDVRMIETTVSQRRELTSERMQKETDEQRQDREDDIARRTAVQSQIAETLRPFYCELCDKQFKNVAQYDEHTNSYAHHHKARFRDMQASVRMQPQEEIDRRKEKERRREEKELRKLAKAQGIKITKPVLATAPADVASVAAGDALVSTGGFKKAGWATAVGPGDPSTVSGVKAGWASVGDAPSAGPGLSFAVASQSTNDSVPVSAPSMFRAAGQLVGTGTAAHSSDTPSLSRGGWAPATTVATQPNSLGPPAPPAAVMQPPAQPRQTATADSESQSRSSASRSSWQNFKQKSGRRR